MRPWFFEEVEGDVVVRSSPLTTMGMNFVLCPWGVVAHLSEDVAFCRKILTFAPQISQNVGAAPSGIP